MASTGDDNDVNDKLQQDRGNCRREALEMSEEEQDNKNTLESNDDAPNISHQQQQPPTLSRRPTTIEEEEEDGEHTKLAPGSLTLSKGTRRPKLQSKATTAVSQVEIQGLESASSSPGRSRSRSGRRTGSRVQSSEDEDNASILSVQPYGSSQGGDVESLLGETLENVKAQDDNGGGDADEPTGETMVEDTLTFEHDDLEDTFPTEFDSVEGDVDNGMQGDQRERGRERDEDQREEERAARWRAKLKHYLILSSAGKPIYSRHGDDQIISGTIGVVQTIISFYQNTQDTLKGFTAGNTRFAILSKGHLHLLAVSRLGESDAQLRSQLEALYMQILSTLTLPTMERLFINRPSTDLRRPLQGTESLLSSLADGFTRGSPSVLLSALECLRIRKAHRQTIHSTLLKCRSPNLLYGLLVADGRLAAVVRPKKHSLHPGDLQLIFNMLFEADSIRAGGGESWIPICLPGFNNTGYLYMYVSFLDAEMAADVETKPERRDELAVVLISAKGEAFDELRGMRDTLVSQLQANGSLAHIRRAMANGRSSCTSILQTNLPKGKQDQAVDSVAHFLYKSRANVQFVMPSAAPLFATPVRWRRLMNLYGRLQSSLHSKTPHLKLIHVVTTSATALAWTTPTFEIFVVAGRGATRPMLARAASGIVEWARREEERLFVVGGGVF